MQIQKFDSESLILSYELEPSATKVNYHPGVFQNPPHVEVLDRTNIFYNESSYSDLEE